MATSSEPQKLVVVSEVTAFVQRCMEAVGAAAPHAASLAEVILAADERGHYSHGLNRLGQWDVASQGEGDRIAGLALCTRHYSAGSKAKVTEGVSGQSFNSGHGIHAPHIRSVSNSSELW